MVKVKFDVSGSDPDAVNTQLAEPPKPGVHKAKLAQCKPGFKKDDDGKDMKDRPRLEVIYEITDKASKSPDGKSAKGALVYAYYTFDDHEISQRKLDQFLQTFGIASKRKRSGTFDTDKIIGLPCKVRIKGETWNNEYSPKVVAVVPGDESDLDDDDALDEDEDEGVEEDEDEDVEGGEEDEEDEGDDLAALGAAADEEDEDAAARLTELAEEAGIDPDTYDTWAEVAEVLGGESEDEEDEDEDTAEDYSTWDRPALAKECKDRSIKVLKSDTVATLRNKLLEDDGSDPF